jgi:hypothetical protein
MRWRHFELLLAAGLGLAAAARGASGPATNGEPVLAPFELRDQYDRPHRIAFPATNITVLTVADQKGSEQIDGWIAPLKERYGEQIAIAGIADLSRVPGLLRSRVRSAFQKRRQHPVMLDWEGPVARGFHCQKDAANLFVIDRDGRVTSHFTGAAKEASLAALFAAVELARAKTPP